MAYVFFILSALVVTQQKAVESSEDNLIDLTRRFLNLPLPDFSNSNRGKNVLLDETEPWIPSKTTQLTFLSPRQPLRVELELNREAQQSVIESCDLLFKCKVGNTSIKTLNLISNVTNLQWKVSEPLCISELGFVVERHNASSYRIRILPKSKVPFSQSLEHYMEFSIKIRYKQGTLTSARLYIFSLISLFNINPEETTINLTEVKRSSSPFRRYFLTREAMAFFVDRNFLRERLNTSVVEINFLEKDLLDVVKRAPTITRALLTVTVSLTLAQSASMLNESKRFLISNGEENFVERAASSGYNGTNDVRHGLSLVTGKLLIERSFIVKMLEEWSTEGVDVTLRVSINGLRNGSEIEEPVTSFKFQNQNFFSVAAAAHLIKCRSLEESQHSNTTIIPFYTGMRDIVLTAPGVCPCPLMQSPLRDCKSDYSVRYTHEHSGNEGGPKFTRRFQDNSRVVTLRGPRGLEDMGSYIFIMRDMPSHNYQLVDANLPMFEALPDVINVNKYGALELECTLHRTGENYKSIHMSSHFLIMNYQTDKIWREMNLDEFATKLLRVPPNKIRKVKATSGQSHGYKLLFPAVDNRWGMWRLSYICRAEIIAAEVNSALGIPKYQFEVRAPVRYHGFGEIVMWNSRRRACSLVSQRSVITAPFFAVASFAAVRWTLNALYY